jgi:hypothetical protein
MSRVAKSGKSKLKLKVINVTVRGKLKKKPVNELSPIERQYYRDLHRIIDDVFAAAAESFDWSWVQLASNAGLAYQTVACLGNRQTKWPRFLTIYRLAKAVGWEIVLKEEEKTVRKPKVLAKAG